MQVDALEACKCWKVSSFGSGAAARGILWPVLIETFVIIVFWGCIVNNYEYTSLVLELFLATTLVKEVNLTYSNILNKNGG